MSAKAATWFGMAVLCLCSSTAWSHDGGFGHSRRLLYVSATPDDFVVEYRLKQGLEEAIVELTHIDTNRDGAVGSEERDQYFALKGKELLARLAFRDAKTGKPLSAELVDFQLGHSLVQIYRLHVAGAAAGVMLEDRNFPHKPGQVAVEVAKGLSAEIPPEVDLTHADRVRVLIERTQVAKPGR